MYKRIQTHRLHILKEYRERYFNINTEGTINSQGTWMDKGLIQKDPNTTIKINGEHLSVASSTCSRMFGAFPEFSGSQRR